MRILNDFDLEQKDHKSVENQIYELNFLIVFHKFFKIYNNLRYEIKRLRFIISIKKMNG